MNKYFFKSRILLILLLFSSIPSVFSQNIPHANVESYDNGGAEETSNEKLNIDPATGTLDIAFPLFSYSNASRGLSHSLSISYNARGVKVDEAASNLGQNWSVNLEGSIQRKIGGLPDELSQLGFSNQSAVPGSGQLTNQYLLKTVEDSLDTQFDVFEFTAGNESGKFIIGKDGSIVTIPQSNVKIEKLGMTSPCSGAPLFKITLENGMQYWFQITDCVQLKYSLERERTAATNWYLTKIIAPFNVDTINFSYHQYIYDYINPPKYIKYEVLAPNPNQGYNFCDADALYSTYSRTSVTCSRLKDIFYPDGTRVSFTYDSRDRFDLRGDYALREVNIINGDNSYGYRFQHSFMDRRSPGGISVNNWNYENTSNDQTLGFLYQDSTHCFSLQLDGFYKFSGTDTVPGYKFNYYRMVPPRRGYQYGVDLWGYFCGSNLNHDRFDVTNRIPDLYYAKAKSMESITLPTGGKIRFEYELHSTEGTNLSPYFNLVDRVGGLRIKKVYRTDGMGQNAIATKEYRYLTESNLSSGVMVNFPAHQFFYVESPEWYNSNPYAYALVTDCGAFQYLNYPADNNFTAHSGFPLNDLVSFQGSPVVYSRVEEYTGDVSNFISKKVYKFSTNNDYGIPSSLVDNNFPFPSIPDLSFAWGLPLETATYTSGNLLKEKTINEYAVTSSQLDNSNFRSLKVGLNHHDIPLLSSYFSYKHYYPITGKVLLTKQKTTQYYENNLSFADSVLLTHNAKDHPKTIQYRSAEGDLILKKLYYPDDYTISGAVATLNSAGLVSAPLTTETWNSSQNKLLSSAASSVQQLSNGSVKIDTKYDFTSTTPVAGATWGTFNPNQLLQQPQYFTAETQSNAYDPKGNLLEYETQGTTYSIIWGNNSHRPQAEVVNGKQTDIAYTGFENDMDWGNWQFLGGTLQLTASQKYTGTQSVLLTASNPGIQKSGLSAAQSYYLTVWTKTGAPQISITTPSGTTSLSPIGSDEHLGWKLYRVKFSNALSVKVSSASGLYLDDLRLYPVGALMTSYSYNSLFGVSSVTNASNKTVYYEYDKLGRKKFEKDMDGNVIRFYEYKYREAQF